MRATRLLSLAALSAAVLLLAAPAQAAGGGRKVTMSQSFLEMGSITASVVQDFQVRAVLQVEVGLDVPDGRAQQRVAHLLPRVRAAFAEALRAYAGDQYAFGRVPDADRIGALLQEAADHALGPGEATVYLGMVLIHQTDA